MVYLDKVAVAWRSIQASLMQCSLRSSGISAVQLWSSPWDNFSCSFIAFFFAVFCNDPDFGLVFLLVTIIHQIIYANKFQLLDNILCACFHEIWYHSLNHRIGFALWAERWHCYKKASINNEQQDKMKPVFTCVNSWISFGTHNSSVNKQPNLWRALYCK